MTRRTSAPTGFSRRSRLPGFTLIELMIYIAITAIVVVALTHAMIAILESRQKAQQVSELQYGLRFSMDRIMERILHAKRVDTVASTFDTDRGAIVLTMPELDKNPTTISLSLHRILLQQGKALPEPLTPSGILINTLRFHPLEDGRVRITIDGIDPQASSGALSHMTVQTSVAPRP